jgi:hypothetical protein
VLATEQEHPGVLPRAVVLDAGGLRPALEIVLFGAGLREEAPNGLELIRSVEMRRARDRHLGVVEIRPRAYERKSLERLRRAAEERDELRVPGRRDDRSAFDGDSVHTMLCLHRVAARDFDEKR